MLRVDLRPGEGVEIDNGRIVVRVEAKSGQICRLAVEAPKEMKVERFGAGRAAAIARQGLTHK